MVTENSTTITTEKGLSVGILFFCVSINSLVLKAR
jgi:hypothetical protein